MNIFKIFFLSLLFVTLNSNAEPVKVEFDTNYGKFLVEVYPDKAPKTVANFLQYVKEDFYKNTIFHRSIPNFMIQGGGFGLDLKEKSTHKPVINEASNGLTNEIGTIAMARTSEPDSATSQFFINVANNLQLNYQGEDPELIGYCVFGKVVKGMNIIQAISKIPTKSVGYFNDVPTKPVVIKNVIIQ